MNPIRITDLDPEWQGMPYQRDGHWWFPHVETIAEAHGIMFACPRCYEARGRSLVGVHQVVCWCPTAPAGLEPGPGRWTLHGTSFHDVTLKGATSTDSVNLEKVVDGVAIGCQAHFFVRDGAIE